MEQLQQILKEQTSKTLHDVRLRYRKILSFLIAGLIFNALISPFLHFLLGDDGPVFRITTGGLLSLVTILLVGLIVVLFYWIRYSGFETELDDDLIFPAISRKIAQLKKARNREIAFIALIFLLLMIISRLSSQYLGHGDFGDIFRKDILIALGSGAGIMLFYIFRRLRAYKQNISELSKLLKEQDEL